MDSLFRAKTLSKTAAPNRLIYMAMHQDYSSTFAGEDIPSEAVCGELIIKRLLKGDRGHYGPLEHPQITINFGYFPHSVMQQVRTHRTGISFDVQSGRYTGEQVVKLGKHLSTNRLPDLDARKKIEEVFYLRPSGEYTDRSGKRYVYSDRMRYNDLMSLEASAIRYKARLERGEMSEEHARGMLPFDIRQHFVMSANMRTVMHLLDMRHKKDAQLECQQWADLLFQEFEQWSPILADWYEGSRLNKGRLAP